MTDKRGLTVKQKTVINICLIVAGLATILTGFVIQLKYHMGGLSPISEAWGLAYSNWSFLHKLSIVFFSLLMVFHIALHWKWYKIIIARRMIARNKETVILSVIFFFTTVTGFAAWFADILNTGTSLEVTLLRKTFIEIHDKIAIILTIYIILHTLKRLKRI
jgi:hypothetical protein